MVHLQRSLIFPSLTFQSDARFKNSESDKTTPIFKLNWDTIEKIKAERWLKQNSKSSNSKFPGTLPTKYDEWVKDMFFALPEAYLSEIHRCARLAQTEWGTSRNFDTMIQEICLKPSIEYAYVAFRLLADCLYDKNTSYFYRGPDKVIATQAMLYKFWSFQVGSGVVQSNSKFDKIKVSLNRAALQTQRSLLMDIICNKCGEKVFLEASSDGWKVNMSDIEVICSCGNKVVGMAPPAPPSAHPYPLNDDSDKYHARNFLNSIDEYEKKIEEQNRVVTLSPAIDKYVDVPVKEIKFRDTNRSVIDDLRSKGYGVYNNNPHSILKPPQVATEGTVVKAISPIPKINNIVRHDYIIPDHEESFTPGVPGSCTALKELIKANETMTQAMEPRGDDNEKIAENMLFSELKKGLKDLPKEPMNKIKVLVNGMPIMELLGCNQTGAWLSEKDAVSDALKMEKIIKYTKGKELLKTIYVPGYLLSMAFGRPEKKKVKKK